MADLSDCSKEELLKLLEASEAERVSLKRTINELEKKGKSSSEDKGRGSFSSLIDRSQRTFQWKEALQLPDITSLCTATIYQGNVYVAATSSSADSEEGPVTVIKQSPANCLQKWSNLPAPVETSRCEHLFVHDDNLYLLSRTAVDGFLRLWKLQNSSWTGVTSSPSAAVKDIAATVVGRHLVLAGGTDIEGTSVDAVHAYNLSSDSWEQWQSLPMRLSSAQLVIYNDQLLLVGGRTRSSNVLKHDSCAVYCCTPSAAEEWTEHMSSLHPLCGPAALSCNGQIVTAGGRCGDGVSSDVMCWSAETKEWLHLPPLCIATALSSLVFSDVDGKAKLIAIGGFYEGVFASGTVQSLSLC